MRDPSWSVASPTTDARLASATAVTTKTRMSPAPENFRAAPADGRHEGDGAEDEGALSGGGDESGGHRSGGGWWVAADGLSVHMILNYRAGPR